MKWRELVCFGLLVLAVGCVSSNAGVIRSGKRTGGDAAPTPGFGLDRTGAGRSDCRPG